MGARAWRKLRPTPTGLPPLPMRTPRPTFVLLAPLLLLACQGASPRPLPVPAPAPPEPVALPDDLDARLERLVADLEEQREALHVSGLAAAIVHGDRVIWAGGLGLADREAGEAVDPETLFQIGSTTKAFTATLLAQQVERGLADWDAPVNDYLPGFEPPVRDEEGRRATLRDLLAHRTGFTRMGLLWAGGQASREEVLRTANGAEPWAGFRERFLYNNVMYLAAGEASAAIAGTDWDTLLAERLIDPLGMDSTTSRFDEAERDPRLAKGYRWDADASAYERDPRRNLDTIAPAGSIQSNVLDMSRWLRMLLARGRFEGRQLVSAARLEDTWSPQIQLGPGVSYGLGWFLREWEGRRYVEHGGNIDGFCAQIALLPEERLGAVLLANVGSSRLQGTFGPLVFEALLGEGPAAAADDGSATEDFEPFLGTYIANFSHFRDARFEVQVHEGRLAVDIPGQMLFDLRAPDAEGRRTFVFTDQVAVRFVESPDGSIEALELHQGGYTFEVPREGVVPAPEVPLAELEPYLGPYDDPAFEDPIRVRVQNNRLSVDVPGQQVYELRAPDEDGHWDFRISSELAIEFHRDDEGAVDALTFHERGTERLCRRKGAAADELPLRTLEEVLAMRGAAQNEAALAALGTVRLTGTVRFPQSGVEGEQTVLFDAEGRLFEDLRALPFVRLQAGFDGTTAWRASTLEPYDELSGVEAAWKRLSHPMFLRGDWSRRFESATVLRTRQTDDGHERVVVRLKGPEDLTFTVEVDVESGHLTEVRSTEPVPGLGGIAVTSRFEDWRAVGGMTLPMRVITENDSSGRTVIEFTDVETGVEVDVEAYRHTEWR